MKPFMTGKIQENGKTQIEKVARNILLRLLS